jgi:ribonuclease J
MGVEKDNIFIIQSGDVIKIQDGKMERDGQVQSGMVFVDGLGVGDVGNVVLRDRQRLAADGIMLITFAMDAENRVVSELEIVTRGFVYVKEADELLEDIHMIVDDTIMEHFEKENPGGRAKLKNSIKDVVGEFVWKKTMRRPMVLPVILDVE